MQSLVIYSTRTGNTKYLAEAVYDTLGGEKTLVPIAELPQLLDSYELIAVGFSIMAARIEPRAAKFLSSYDAKAKLFLFATHGSATGSALVKNVMEQAAGLVQRSELVGSFTCRGEVNPRVLYKLRKSSQPPPWLDEADESVGHPNEQDIQELSTVIRNIFPE